MKLHYPFGHPHEGADVLWRCEAKRYSHIIDIDREEYSVTEPRLELTYYYVNSRTEKGAWIREDLSWARFINLSHNKAFARNTVDEAVKDFIARRKRQIAILEGQLQRAQRELNLTVENPRNKFSMEFMLT